MTPKRINKTKNEIAQEMAYTEKLKRFKSMATRIFPLLVTDTIYDAQTALDAVSGFIKEDIAIRESAWKVNDLPIDFSSQPEGKITNTMNAIKVELQQENALEVSEFLELFSRTFTSFGSKQFLAKPMSEISMDDIIA